MNKSDIKEMVRECFKRAIVREEKMTKSQLDKREEIVKTLKGKKDEFVKKYGDDWESVMYATATKLAKEN